ncbi:MAG TPA: CoA pyrophosphatase [Polyangia bacterium]
MTAPGADRREAPQGALEAQVAALRARLAARPRHGGAPADHPARPAAVLALLVPRDGELRLVFTLRPEELAAHGGQISFPGGKCTPADADAAACALREAAEELGVAPASVEVLGLLDDVVTPTGFLITPVVGRVPAEPVYQPDPGEVAAVFAVPLARLAAVGRDAGVIPYGGVEYRMYEYPVEGRVVWGATARMVHQLLELWLSPAPAGP